MHGSLNYSAPENTPAAQTGKQSIKEMGKCKQGTVWGHRGRVKKDLEEEEAGMGPRSSHKNVIAGGSG